MVVVDSAFVPEVDYHDCLAELIKRLWTQWTATVQCVVGTLVFLVCILCCHPLYYYYYCCCFHYYTTTTIITTTTATTTAAAATSSSSSSTRSSSSAAASVMDLILQFLYMIFRWCSPAKDWQSCLKIVHFFQPFKTMLGNIKQVWSASIHFSFNHQNICLLNVV